MSKRLDAKETCRRKVATYKDPRNALDAAKKAPSTKGRLYPYRCAYCSSWHLSSITQWEKDRKRKLNVAARAEKARYARTCKRCGVKSVRRGRYCWVCAEHFIMMWYRSMGMLDAPVD